MHKIKLLEKKVVAQDTMSFTFEKPAGYTFKPGQHTFWTLPEGGSRKLSFASQPKERHLTVASRMFATPFKQALHDLNPGDVIKISKPLGDFVLNQKNHSPAVFLVGGIGITPFRSIINHELENGLTRKIYLFYSNHTSEHAAFLKELKDIKNPNFKLITIMTEIEKIYITHDLIVKHVSNLDDNLFYLAGPPPMVAALYKMLTDHKVSPKNIKYEQEL